MNPADMGNFLTVIMIVAGGIGGYVKLMTKIKELEIRLNSVEKQDDKIINKLDLIAEAISEIKIEMQNKQDRE